MFDVCDSCKHRRYYTHNEYSFTYVHVDTNLDMQIKHKHLLSRDSPWNLRIEKISERKFLNT